MAFLDEFQKLLVKKGKQTKVKDKDKAIILMQRKLINNNNLKIYDYGSRY